MLDFGVQGFRVQGFEFLVRVFSRLVLLFGFFVLFSKRLWGPPFLFSAGHLDSGFSFPKNHGRLY